MIKKFVNEKILNGSPTKSIAAAAFIISAAGIVSRILGLFRDRILAAQFGAGDVLDVYYAAFRLPDTIYNLLVLGALSAAFIPVFTELISKGDDEDAWRLSSGILNVGVFILVLLSIILVVFMPYFMKFIVPGFSDEKTKEAIMFTRLMMLSPIFLGISAVFGGILVSFRKFLVYSLAPIMYNIGIIIGAVFFVKIVGTIGLAWGVALGSFLHMLIQLPAVKFSGFKFKLFFFESRKNYYVRKVFILMIPRILGIAASQINLLVITFFASAMPVGSLAIFNFANNIQSAPIGLFGISFAIAVFPTLSVCASRGENKNFIKSFSQSFRQIMFFIIPLSVFIVILRAQLVRVVLGSGKFDWEDTTLTLNVLGALAASLFAQSLIPLLTRAFYALQNTKIPFFIALFSEAVNIVAVILLKDKYQVLGLAMAFSIASVVNMFMLLTILRFHFDDFDEKNILKSILKISLASLAAGIAVQYLKYFVNDFVNLDTFAGIFVQLVVAGGIGAAIYLLTVYLFRLEEFYYFKQSITKRIFKTRDNVIEDPGEVGGL